MKKSAMEQSELHAAINRATSPPLNLADDASDSQQSGDYLRVGGTLSLARPVLFALAGQRALVLPVHGDCVAVVYKGRWNPPLPADISNLPAHLTVLQRQRWKEMREWHGLSGRDIMSKFLVGDLGDCEYIFARGFSGQEPPDQEEQKNYE